MFNRILIPTDFSRASDTALAHARILARGTGATLHLLHVVDTVPADLREYESPAYEQLQQRLSGTRPGDILVVERSASPADEIARYARAHDIDLIVMGTHGRGRPPHLPRGSVAEQVARTAPCPVLTMRGTSGTRATRRPRILVPTDFSPCSDAALDCARQLATKVRTSICLLHVIDNPAIGVTVGSELRAPESVETRQDQMAHARVELGHRMLADSRARAATTADIVCGASAAMISAYAADHDFDIIVMGTHGRGEVAHPLTGSVAESMIRTAPCPVLTVKSWRAEQLRAVNAEAAYAAA